MSVQVKIGGKSIEIILNKEGSVYLVNTQGIEKEEIKYSCDFLRLTTDFNGTKEEIEAILKSYITTKLVSYELGKDNWGFKQVLLHATSSLEDGFFRSPLMTPERVEKLEKILKQAEEKEQELISLGYIKKDSEKSRKLLKKRHKKKKKPGPLMFDSEEKDYEYFKRIIGLMDNKEQIEELSKNAEKCYHLIKLTSSK